MYNLGLRPTEACLQRMCEAFPKDARVELVYMDDPYRRIPAGTRGTVIGVDGMGTIHVSWDKHSSLGAVWNVDVIKNIQTEAQSNSFWNDNSPLAML